MLNSAVEHEKAIGEFFEGQGTIVTQISDFNEMMDEYIVKARDNEAVVYLDSSPQLPALIATLELLQVTVTGTVNSVAARISGVSGGAASLL